jgi:hypothetical protein
VSLEWTLLALRLLAVAVLYVFLAVVVLIIWRDLRSAARTQPGQGERDQLPVDVPAGWLRVIASGDTSLQSMDAFALFPPTTLGRATENDVVLSDAWVSLHHARIERRDEEWWLADLGSQNGTRLNGAPVTTPVPLADGDVIGIGQMEIVFEIERDANYPQ